MKLSLSPIELHRYVHKLLGTYLPDSADIQQPSDCFTPFQDALMRLEYCFAPIKLKYYSVDGVSVFNHLHADHMATLLYFYSNTLWQLTNDPVLPSKLSYLNKILHSLDLYYTVEMPNIFLLVHPVGSVIGSAKLSDFLVVYQGCTIGSSHDSYPSLGQGVVLYSRTSILGNSTVGHNVLLSANSFLLNCNIPANSTVVGQYPNHRILHNGKSVLSRCFSADI